MSVGLFALPSSSDESCSDDDGLEPPKRDVLRPPKKIDAPPQDEPSDPFEVVEKNLQRSPNGDTSYFESLGLPPYTTTSHPFLSEVSNLSFRVKRHRLWIRGVKGVKFQLSISGNEVIVAKRKRSTLKSTWYFSQSLDYALDTPDLIGTLIKERNSPIFTLFGPDERSSDGFVQVLAFIDLSNETPNVQLYKDFWVDPNVSKPFEVGPDDKIQLQFLPRQYTVASEKNASFSVTGENNPCYLAEKQTDKTVSVLVSAPLSLLTAFGICVSFFMR